MKKSSNRLLELINGPIFYLLLVRLMSGMLISPRATFFPIYLKELGYTAVLIASLTSIQRSMGLVVSLMGGVLSDRISRKHTLLLGLIGMLLGCMVYLTPAVGWIGVLWVVSGIGMGFYTLGGQSYLIDVASPRHLGLLTAFFYWGVTIGGAVSNPLAGFLLENWTYRGFGVVLSALATAIALVAIFLLPHSKVKPERKGVSWRGFFGYRDLIARPSMLVLVLLRFLPTFYYGMASIFIPLMLDAAGAGKMTIALYAGVSMIVSAACQGLVGHLADRLNCRGPTVASFVVLICTIFGIALFPSQVPLLIVFGALGNAAAWSLSTLFPSLVSEVTEANERGRALGLIHLFWNLAMILGPAIGGFLFERWIALPFFLAGGMNLLSLVLIRRYYRLTASAVH